jgi:CTP synthase
MPSTYLVPILLKNQGLIPLLTEVLGLNSGNPIDDKLLHKGEALWNKWLSLTTQPQETLEPVIIALVGKYTSFQDSYLSVVRSLEHCAMRCRRRLNLVWVDSELLEPISKDRDPANYHKAWHQVCTAHGVLVPGGFGIRGTEGMIAAAQWARENDIPFLGICLGMQIAVIEFARNVCGVKAATSAEFVEEKGTPKVTSMLNLQSGQNGQNGVAEQTNGVSASPAQKRLLNDDDPDHVIIFMPEGDKTKMGGTMRLGRRTTHFQSPHSWSKLKPLYGNELNLHERHRHRYEVNPSWVSRLEDAGLSFVGKDDSEVRMEVVEIESKKWFVGVQYHPEYLSRVLKPSPPYLGFVAAASGVLTQITKEELGKAGSKAAEQF